MQHLAEVQFHEHKSEIYLPDVLGRPLPVSELVYDDTPWLFGLEGVDNSFGSASTMVFNAKRTSRKFVQGNISNDTAKRLGVSSLWKTLLAESADLMNSSLFGAAEAFGQHEALTTRLKYILETYANGTNGTTSNNLDSSLPNMQMLQIGTLPNDRGL